MRFIVTIIISLFSITLYAQESTDTNLVKQVYKEAFDELNDMLTGTKEIDFKRAVFITENAYFGNALDYGEYCYLIESYKLLAEQYIDTNPLAYDEKDKEKVSVYASVFKIMKDTTPILLDNDSIIYHLPFTYDFDDVFGFDEWSHMFVNKLLLTHNGNCHSLPLLYKILVEELGEKAYLALAPNHMYIKLQSKEFGWYNTELTSGIFPIDAWLMASGYIHLSAIQNGIYMDTLSQKQSIALCMIDLAQGYQRKLETKNEFVLKCCDTALVYYPNFINALLLKAETKLNIIRQSNSKTFVEKEMKELKLLYQKIHDLGYRKMPEQMYLEWLVSLKEEKNKYQNKKINFIK